MSKKEQTLYEKLKAIEPFSLSFHHDADGIYSAGLLLSVFEVSDVECPPFNEYTTDVAVDLGRPFKKGWKGICIDHHPDHPKDRDYDLYWDTCPTGLVIYNNLKDHIPKQHIWKVVGSLCGDGQPELTPDIVWDTFPILLQERGYVGKGQYGKTYTTGFPLLYFLSSGINAIAKLGFPMQALEVVNRAVGPLDILDNAEVKDARDRFRSEEADVYKSKPVIENLSGRYKVIRVNPSNAGVNIASTIASKIGRENTGKTIIVINEATGKVSLRGILAKYVSNKLNAKGFKAGGHAGYCGANLDPSDIDEFMNVIRGL